MYPASFISCHYLHSDAIIVTTLIELLHILTWARYLNKYSASSLISQSYHHSKATTMLKPSPSSQSFVSLVSSIGHKTSQGCCNKSLGLLLAFISGVLMTTYSSMLKLMKEMDSIQVVIIRGVLQLVIMGGIAMYKRLSFRGTSKPKMVFFMFLVAFTGGLRLVFIFTSFSRLPLGDSSAILFSSPVIVMFLSIFILHEKCGVFRVIASATLLGGVFLIAKPPFVFRSDETDQTYDVLGSYRDNSLSVCYLLTPLGSHLVLP